jgi:hypothetical protein
MGAVVHSSWGKSEPGISEAPWLSSARPTRKAGGGVGLDASFRVARTLVTVMKSLHLSGAS